MANTYSLPLKLAYNSSRGFHIQMHTGGSDVHYTAENLPGVFIKITKFKNTFSFTTADMVCNYAYIHFHTSAKIFFC